MRLLTRNQLALSLLLQPKVGYVFLVQRALDDNTPNLINYTDVRFIVGRSSQTLSSYVQRPVRFEILHLAFTARTTIADSILQYHNAVSATSKTGGKGPSGGS